MHQYLLQFFIVYFLLSYIRKAIESFSFSNLGLPNFFHVSYSLLILLLLCSAIKFLSNSAITHIICNIALPVGVLVSIFSFNDTNWIPISSNCWMMLKISNVFRPKREILSTTTVSPFLITSNNFTRPCLSRIVPVNFSLMIFSHPYSVREWIWRSKF